MRFQYTYNIYLVKWQSITDHNSLQPCGKQNKIKLPNNFTQNISIIGDNINNDPHVLF